ncbi:MAG: hypothetical protein RL268_2552 [Pseudomonadota bacterium]|jgi:hypothetical protein
MKAATARTRRKGGNAAGAGLLFVAVGMLALPSAVLAFSSRFDSFQIGSPIVDGGFQPAVVDPRLARSITVRALSKDRTFRFTPAATPSRPDGAVTVAIRVDGRSLAMRSRGAAAQAQGGGLGIAPSAYSLGAARGYRSFAHSAAPSPAPQFRSVEMPDLASFQPREPSAGKPSRFTPRVEFDEREKTGRSPRTFEQSDQTVGVGGAYRVTRNLDVTAGVRVTSDRDRLLPLTDGKQDNQAVYVGTQYRF